jgi:hypothetical protein
MAPKVARSTLVRRSRLGSVLIACSIVACHGGGKTAPPAPDSSGIDGGPEVNDAQDDEPGPPIDLCSINNGGCWPGWKCLPGDGGPVQCCSTSDGGAECVPNGEYGEPCATNANCSYYPSGICYFGFCTSMCLSDQDCVAAGAACFLPTLSGGESPVCIQSCTSATGCPHDIACNGTGYWTGFDLDTATPISVCPPFCSTNSDCVSGLCSMGACVANDASDGSSLDQ